MGSFAWDISFGVFRLETFVCDPSLENFRLEISLGSFRARPSALKHSLGNVGFGSFVSELSLGIFRLGYSTWDDSIGSFRLGSFA